jgi:hypothetical protein
MRLLFFIPGAKSASCYGLQTGGYSADSGCGSCYGQPISGRWLDVSTFACCALDMQDFDKSLDEIMAGRHSLTLLERSQLRAAF